jgi:hypothetical protein
MGTQATRCYTYSNGHLGVGGRLYCWASSATTAAALPVCCLLGSLCPANAANGTVRGASAVFETVKLLVEEGGRVTVGTRGYE